MHGEVTWDQFDRLVEAHAAASLYVGEVRELEVRIARSMADLLRYPGTFGDLTSLLAARAPSREMMTRRVAWAAQHVLGKRAWCVGAKVLVKLPGGDDMAYGSPLLDQLRLLGFISAGERQQTMEAPGEAELEIGREKTRKNTRGSSRNTATAEPLDAPVDAGSPLDFEMPVLDKLDAMLCTPASDEVWVVKGVSYSQVSRLSPELWVNADRESLFGSDDRFMSRVVASGTAVRTLLAARDLVQVTHPALKVRACFLVINDPGCSWHFQAHDLTAARPGIVKGGRDAKVKLDGFPVLATHRNFPANFAKEGLELATLPEWSGDDALSALPADRPSRSLLLLAELWNRQLNRPKRLSTSKGDELAESVARTSGVGLGRDQWRHDLEDCLERSGLVRRLPDRPGRFAVTPKGVGRLLLLKSKLAGGVPLTPAALLQHVGHQSRLWAAAPVA